MTLRSSTKPPALIERITGEYGPITCLVNNAGMHLKKPAIETTPEEFQKVLGTHIFGAHALSCAVVPGMIERKHGCVIFMASSWLRSLAFRSSWRMPPQNPR